MFKLIENTFLLMVLNWVFELKLTLTAFIVAVLFLVLADYLIDKLWNYIKDRD